MTSFRPDYLDRYSRGDSVIHRLDARWKLLAALALVAAIVAVPGRWWAAYLVLGPAAFGLYAASRLPWSYLAKRLAFVLPFLLLLAAGVPVSHGLAGGYEQAGLLLVRSLLSLVVMITLVATTPFPKLLAALERLKTPRVLVWILAFMYRYMFVLVDELARMRRAKQARSFRRSYFSDLRHLGSFAGVLFLRSLERAERVHAAMCARGWNGELPATDDV